MPSRSPARPAADPPVAPKPRATKAAASGKKIARVAAKPAARKIAEVAAKPTAAEKLAKPAAKKIAKTAAEKLAKPAAEKLAKSAAEKLAKSGPKKLAKTVPRVAGATASDAAEPAAKATRPSGQAPKAGPGVGDPAPDFSLPADDGKTYSLAALRGRRVVLYFYPRDNTPGCTTEACDFRDRQDAFARAGATVLGVSGDSPKAHASFRGKQRLNFPLLSDAGNAVAGAYGAFGDKMMYGRSLQGIIRSTFVIGPDGALEAVWRPVKVPGHAETVLQTVAARAAAKK